MAAKRTRTPSPRHEASGATGLHVVGGIIWGATIALMLSLWVTAVYLVGGAAPFRENGTTYRQAVLMYFVAGVVVGALFGLVRPMIRGGWSAAVFGFVAGCAVFSMLALATGEYNPLAVLLAAALLGPAVGWQYWKMFG